MKTDIEKNSRRINKIRKKINRGRIINQDILKVYLFFVAIFAALILFACYFMSFQASSVINNSYNRRSDALNKTVLRGDILSDDGTVLATSYINNETEIRVYPYNNAFAHVVGFHSNGGMGLESSYNYYLLTSHEGLFEKIYNEFHHVKNQGDSVQTTLKAGLQNYIYEILGNSHAAVVCMNPDTGEVYAMVSKPDFDPNTISSNWDAILAQEQQAEEFGLETDSVLLNRVTQGRFTPGSTFKLFTLYEYYLENPKVYEQFSYDCDGMIQVGDTTISCYNGVHHDHENLLSAFANSCNCAFGTIGKNLDLDQFRATCSRLLFDTDLPIDMDSSKSNFTLTAQDSEFDIVATAIGQGNTQITPLHLAMIISAVANEGICMKPHLVKYILTPDHEITKQFKIEPYKTLFTAEEAQMLKTYLRAVVTDGTGSVVYPGNFQAYGKTGTAEKESSIIGDYDHSWFAGWAENNEQKLAVCVILENMDASGMTGAYVAKLIFDYYFSVMP